MIDLIYYALAVWYISYIVTSKRGPFDVFKRLREFKKGLWHGRTIEPEFFEDGQRRLSGPDINEVGLLDCIICLAPWVAVIVILIGHNIITDAFAIAGIALMLHSFTGWRMNI